MEQEQQPELSWIQVEYIKHEKSPQWYIAFVVIFLVLAVIIFLSTKSFFSIAVVLLAAIASLIYSNKEPQRVKCELFPDGFSVNSREYFFDDFRSFSPITEQGLRGVIFNPIGRLQLPMNLYFTEENQQAANELLASSLIVEQYKPDLLQRLIDSARF